MGTRQWMAESYNRIRRNGIKGAKHSFRPVKNKILSFSDPLFSSGDSIYEMDWDLLIVMDACRLDLMQEVAADYDWIEQIESIRSVNSTTTAWMRDTFTEDRRRQMAETAYICGNPFSESKLDSRDFSVLEEVWKSAWTDPGTVPPEAITDETIRIMRETDHDYVIAHYMQPHCPFLSKPKLSRGKELDKFGNQDWRDVWEQLEDGDLNRNEVWEGYRDNLHYGLDEVEELLRNVDADKVIITSDHGNAVGEWTVYGHPPDLPLTCLRSVPWIETSATDDETREIGDWDSHSIDTNREEQLSALGYR
ncbi:hypothetical protein [Haloarcula japonica]|uniref:Sulfatase N-terminal domain-containing protein n=1 Tax=Haloarcula japonica (strain ATCC 49778 / DSM 6131 / JCM 7785 / NBRC 101032 / NCIMB 13157 / TR-1) TaxID=1227453 RepID=M0LBI1_HALJT|nr:hypothetical protein [Haloarcula japonica]EMA30468.1 hypothetical protein C444_09797 [Haloarcula japonica DSM 6131]